MTRESVFWNWYTVLKMRVGFDTAKEFIDAVFDNKDIGFIYSESILLHGTLTSFIDDSTKKLSFVDSSLVYLSNEYKIVTFDKDLQKVLPTGT